MSLRKGGRVAVLLLAVLFAGGCSLKSQVDGETGGMAGLRAVDGQLISALDAHDGSLSIVKYTNSFNTTGEERLFFLSDRSSSGVRQLYSSVRLEGALQFSAPQPVNIFTTNTGIITAQAVAVSNMVCVFATGYLDGSYRSSVWRASAEAPTNFTEITLNQNNPESCIIGVLPPGTLLPNLQIPAGTIGLLTVSATATNSTWSRISYSAIGVAQLASGYTETRTETVLPEFAGRTVSGDPSSGGVVSTVSVVSRRLTGLDCDLLLYGRVNRYGNFDLAVSDGTERDFIFDALVSRHSDHSPFFYSGDGQLYFVSDGYTDVDRQKQNLFYWELLPLKQTVLRAVPQQITEFYRTVTFDTRLTGTAADRTTVYAKSRILYWPEDPYKFGVLFTGWTNSSGVVFSVLSNAVMPAGDLVLYPRWGVDPALRTVTFLPNGGSGTMEPQIVSTNGGYALALNTFVKTGSNFNGWSFSAGGLPVYADGAVLPAGSSNISLYATWQLMTNRLILDRNGADQVSNVSPVLLAYNESYLLQTNVYTRTDCTFRGWSPTADGAVIYTNGYSVKMGETDITLYAQWFQDRFFAVARGSRDAQTIAALTGFGSPDPGIFVSRDGGITWTQTYSGDRDFSDIAVSGDGKYMTAVAKANDLNAIVLISSDYGSTWTEKTTTAGPDLSLLNLASVAMSGNGQKIYIGINDVNGLGTVCYSLDGGGSFQMNTNLYGGVFLVRCSDDGNRLLINIDEGNSALKYSSDGGVVWQDVAWAAYQDLLLAPDGSKAVRWMLNGAPETAASNDSWTVWSAMTFPNGGSPNEIYEVSLAGAYSAAGSLQILYCAASTYSGMPSTGSVWRSSDLSGWIQVSGQSDWVSVVPSADGSRLIGITESHGIFVTTNGNDAAPVWTRQF